MFWKTSPNLAGRHRLPYERCDFAGGEMLSQTIVKAFARLTQDLGRNVKFSQQFHDFRTPEKMSQAFRLYVWIKLWRTQGRE
jgi:hypothetical protein